MATNEELIQAARMLKKHCEKCYREGKCNCDFAKGYDCMLNSVPASWQLPKPRRWTDADIQLAKALKAFGVKEIYRYGENWPSGRGDDKSTSCCELPDSTFASLQPDETVSVDDILREESDAVQH